ncbi:MAG: hypothetical protein ACOX56_06140 [Acholeplasmataceae bacterium]|jgi:hypothetical protein
MTKTTKIVIKTLVLLIGLILGITLPTIKVRANPQNFQNITYQFGGNNLNPDFTIIQQTFEDICAYYGIIDSQITPEQMTDPRVNITISKGELYFVALDTHIYGPPGNVTTELELEISNSHNDIFLACNADTLETQWDPTPDDDFIITMKIDIEDVYVPIINGQTNYITNVNHPVNQQTIKSGLSAHDNVDGYIPSSSFVLVNDNYTQNMYILGTYTLKYSVSDAAGNTSYVIVNVKVVDVDPPLIYGTDTYDVVAKQKLPESTIRSALGVTDNYDETLDIVLVQDNYTSNFDKLGTYTITYRATDSSNNSTDFIVTVNVTDDLPPVIYTNRHFINIDGTLNYTIEQIIEHLIAIGQLNPNTMMYYSVQATNYKSIPGEYEIILVKNAGAPQELDDNIIIEIQVYDKIDQPFNDDNQNNIIIDNGHNSFFNENMTLIIGLAAIIIVLGGIGTFVLIRRRRRIRHL